jgi:hypothetical protein
MTGAVQINVNLQVLERAVRIGADRAAQGSEPLCLGKELDGDDEGVWRGLNPVIAWIANRPLASVSSPAARWKLATAIGSLVPLTIRATSLVTRMAFPGKAAPLERTVERQAPNQPLPAWADRTHTVGSAACHETAGQEAVLDRLDSGAVGQAHDGRPPLRVSAEFLSADSDGHARHRSSICVRLD